MVCRKWDLGCPGVSKGVWGVAIGVWRVEKGSGMSKRGSVAAAPSWHFAILVNKLGKILKIFEQLDHI